VRLRGALLALWLGGCATASSPAATQTGPRTIAADEAREKVTAVLKAQYAALEKGAIDDWGAALAPDAFFFGARPEDALPSKASILAAWHQALDPLLKGTTKLSVASTQLAVGLSTDGRAAWASDVIEVTIHGPNGDAKEVQRVTEVIAEQDGQWWVHALHWSIGVPNERAMQRARDGTQPKLHEVSESVAPGAQSVVAEFQKAAWKTAELVHSIAERPDALVFGTAPEETIVGGDKIRNLLQQQIHDFGLTITRRGGLRAGVTPNGRVGWVASNIDLAALPAPEEGKPSKPVRLQTRGLLVYLNEGGLWRLVQGHFSNGADTP
jgi:ketosteroid isomerase-like protein